VLSTLSGCMSSATPGRPERITGQRSTVWGTSASLVKMGAGCRRMGVGRAAFTVEAPVFVERTSVGLDVHARSVVAVGLDGLSGEVFRARLGSELPERSCEDRLATYRAALEAGADPAVVTSWIAEVTAERTRHQIDLDRANGQTRLSRDQIASQVNQLADLAQLLQQVDPATAPRSTPSSACASPTTHEKRLVTAEARPDQACTKSCVLGGT
jgi:hypothetical protein